MNRLSKLVAVMAVLPIMATSGVALADSPGQLTGGSNTFMVKNLTQNGAYANNVSAACKDEVQYSVRLHNAAFGGLTSIKVSANIMSGNMTAVPAEGASQGTTGTATVSMPSNGSIAYEAGSTVLYDVNGNVIKNLPDGITTAGVNVGDIAGSTTEFVDFKAQVACPPAQSFSSTKSVTIPVSQTVTVTVNCPKGDTTSSESATATQSTSVTGSGSATSTVSQADADSKALAAAQADANSKVAAATQQVKDKATAAATSAANAQCTATTPPTVTTTTPPALPNTGPGDMAELFVGASALGSAGHFAVRRFRR